MQLNDPEEGPKARQIGGAEGDRRRPQFVDRAGPFFVRPRTRVGLVVGRSGGPTPGDHTMNTLRKFHPDLQACELEDRLLPVVANLGVIVLTTGGYVLMTPYPGGSLGSTAIPTSFSMTGSGGISSVQPGNFTGIPALAVTLTAGSSGGVGATIGVGSGANDPTALTIPLVTRNTIANDALVPPPQIGRPSGDGSPVLPVGLYYRGGVAEPVPAPPSTETPGGQSSRSPHQRPVDSSPFRLGGALQHAAPDVSGNSMNVRMDRMA
jgi:hypothetical protein